MTDSTLLAFIKANDTLKALADHGCDAAIATACCVLSPRVPSNFTLDAPTMVRWYGPVRAEEVLKKIAADFPTTHKMLDEGDGLKVADKGTKEFAATLRKSGTLTAEEVAKITERELTYDTVTPEQVSTVLALFRPDGKATAIDWAKV